MRSKFENWVYSVMIAGLPIFALKYNIYVILAAFIFCFLILLLLNFEIRSFLILGIVSILMSMFFKVPYLEDLAYLYLLLGVIGIQVQQRVSKKERVEKVGKVKAEVKVRGDSKARAENIMAYASWTFFIVSLPFMFDVWYYAFAKGELKTFFLFIAFGLFALGFLLRTLEQEQKN